MGDTDDARLILDAPRCRHLHLANSHVKVLVHVPWQQGDSMNTRYVTVDLT